MTHCPSCGRYVGPYEACPYCGARLSGRLAIRLVKASAILLVSLGLPILWLAATRAEIPSIAIDQANATTNMAYVRVSGWVVREPTYYEDSNYLSFTLCDEDGEEIRVGAYHNETAALRSARRIPALGDWVTVAGTLRVREDSVSLTLNVPEHLDISRTEAAEREIGAVTVADHLNRVRIQGQVWAVRTPYDGLTIVTLRDLSGTIDVAISRNLETLTGAFLPVVPGQSVEVIAAVSLYQDNPQLVPASVQDVRLIPESVPVAQERDIVTLSTPDAGQMVTLEGTVTETYTFSSGFKCTLDDGTGEIAVLVWKDVYDTLAAPDALGPGARVRVTGVVDSFQGELEVVVERAVDVQVVD
jgi:DNA/RNA endonuclease YhcR with UshA esterase domain